MMLSSKTLILIAGGGSLAMLLGAWGFQYIGGLAPCAMCYWQRWPHMAAVAIAAAGSGTRTAIVPILGALAALTTAAIGLYHTGVERDWWEGPTSCSGDGSALTGLSGAELLSTDIPEAIVMCDEVVWSLLGLSMASWNAVISLGLALIWVAAIRARA